MFGFLKKYKLVLTFVAITALIIVYFNSGMVQKSKVALVKKVNVEKRLVTKTISSSGSVKSKNQADLSFSATQRLVGVYVKKGDQVKKGQLLAKEETQNIQNTAQSYRDARDILLRERDLFIKNEETNKSTLGGEDQYNIRLRQYDEQVSQANAQLDAQISLLKNTSIYAPFDGTIIDTTKEIGETATLGEVVIKIADLTHLQFEINVDQEDYGQLKQEMEAQIGLDAFPNFKFVGKVLSLPKYADGTGNTSFVAELEFSQLLDKMPLLGMTGDAKIIVETSINPVNSLYYEEIFTDEQSKPYVWVIDNGYVTKLTVEIGVEGDIYTQLNTRVDKQIVAPLTSDIEVKDGYKAKIVK